MTLKWATMFSVMSPPVRIALCDPHTMPNVRRRHFRSVAQRTTTRLCPVTTAHHWSPPCYVAHASCRPCELRSREQATLVRTALWPDFRVRRLLHTVASVELGESGSATIHIPDLHAAIPFSPSSNVISQQHYLHTECALFRLPPSSSRAS